MKPTIVHNDKSVEGKSRQIYRQPDNNSEHQGKSARKGQIREMQNMEMEYVYDMLVELRKVAKEADEASLVYYLEMAALEAGEICAARKIEREAAKKKAR